MKIRVDWDLTVFAIAIFLGTAFGNFMYLYHTKSKTDTRIEELESRVSLVTKVCLMYVEDKLEVDKEKSLLITSEYNSLLGTLDPNYILNNLHYEFPPETIFDIPEIKKMKEKKVNCEIRRNVIGNV